jgi:uncharacterized repeat protein (TIGR01451 family)
MCISSTHPIGARANIFALGWRLLLACLLMAALNLAHAQTKAFGIAYQTNAPGDILIVGNTLLTCSTATTATGATTCLSARAGTATTAADNNNNNHSMANVVVDPLAPGLNSSTAGLQLPTGATVLWAGLYWGASSPATTPTDLRKQISFKTPAAGYQTLVADTFTANASNYHAGKTVTDLVTAGGSGSYTAANVKVTLNAGDYAGWSLVVVYQLNSDQYRNLTVFDGYNTVSGNSISIPVSGFLTPATGVVGARIGIVAYEGDLGTTGDRLQINSTDIGDSLNPFSATTAANRNPFNSSITRLGTRISDKNPDYPNQMGFDIDVISANGILANNATSANVVLLSTGDAYYPGIITTAIDIFVPNLAGSLTKAVSDVNGGVLEPGDFLDYTISFSNTGQDIATKVFVIDPIPAGTTYVPNSLQVVSGANAGAKTDAVSSDQAEFLTGPDRVVFRVGNLANGTAGGSLAPTESTSVRFRVQVNPGTNGTVINNTATVSYNSQTLGTLYTASKSVTITVVALPSTTAPLLTHQKTVQVVSDPINGTVNPKNIPGAENIYTITVNNTGLGGVDTNTLVIVDALPTNSELFTGNFSSGAPYIFTDGSLPSGLSCPFTALGNLSDCVDFSTDGGVTWAYVANGGYDPAVTHLRFRMAGAMNADTVAGSPYPGFNLQFRVRVK